MAFMNIGKSITAKFTILLTLIPLLTSCVSLYSFQYDENSDLTLKQQKIVSAALYSCEQGYGNSLYFNGKKFRNDCSGLIYGIFSAADIDLLSQTAKETGNGVSRLYKVMDKNDLIHKNMLPRPGDLIFWSNTYGEWGKKPLSHIGVVVSVDKDGSIEFVHNNTYLGAIRKERMNLYKPHERMPVNHYMRYDSQYKKTAAELFDSFGMAWKL